jgi:hypothetical protein
MQPTTIDDLLKMSKKTAPKEAGGIGGLALDLLPFGRQGEKILTGRASEITPGEVASEALLSLVPLGVGKAAKVGKGLFKAGKRGSKAEDILTTSKPGTLPIKDLTSYEGAPDLAQVEKYKQMIKAGEPIDPIKVLKDSTGKIGVEDGKHRLEAFKQLGIDDVPVQGDNLATRALSENRPITPLSLTAERLLGKQTGIIPGSKVGSQELTAERARQLQSHIKDIGANPSDAADTILRRNESFLRNQENAISGVLEAKNSPLSKGAAEEILRSGKPPVGIDLATNSTYKSLTDSLNSATDLKSLNTLRRDIDEIINFSRSAASPDPASERIAMAFRKSISDYMGNKIPELKPLNAAYSKGKDVETFIRPAATKPGGANIFGMNIGGKALQGASGTAGRAVESIAPAVEKATSILSSPIPKFVGQQAGVRAVTDVFGGREYANVFSDPEAGTGTPGEASETPNLPSGTSAPLDQQSRQPVNQRKLVEQALQIAAMQALAQGDHESIKAIQGVASLLPEEKASSKEDAKLANAATTLDQLEGLFGKAGGGQGLLGFGSKALAGARLSPDVEAYGNLRKSAAVSLARAFGEVGALSNQDIEMYAKMLPDVTSSPEAAQVQFDTLRERLGSAQPTGGSAATQILQQYGY